jgi:nicotinate dehydrogenase subunit B
VGPGAQLSGGDALRGWEAPALTAQSAAPVPWTEAEFFSYLRSGYSRLHGAALGPMRAQLRNVSTLPDIDLRAMARYLGSLQVPLPAERASAAVAAAERRARLYNGSEFADGAQIYAGICATCHEAGSGAVVAVHSSLALDTSVHSSRPDNVLRTILDGVNAQAAEDPAAMPSFRDRLDDRQIAQLVGYLRQRFAGDKSAWADVPAAVARARSVPTAD